uniref:Uncharacterized protein n=1 Tax=Arundo donax TaxID=35708 RepID=A0A0A8Y8Z5_ARUDO
MDKDSGVDYKHTTTQLYIGE